MSCWPRGPQHPQNNTNPCHPLGFPLELDDKNILIKILHTLISKSIEVNLELSQKPSQCWLSLSSAQRCESGY